MMKHISKTEEMRKQQLKVKGFRWENKMGLKAFPTGTPWEKKHGCGHRHVKGPKLPSSSGGSCHWLFLVVFRENILK